MACTHLYMNASNHIYKFSVRGFNNLWQTQFRIVVNLCFLNCSHTHTQPTTSHISRIIFVIYVRSKNLELLKWKSTSVQQELGYKLTHPFRVCAISLFIFQFHLWTTIAVWCTHICAIIELKQRALFANARSNWMWIVNKIKFVSHTHTRAHTIHSMHALSIVREMCIHGRVQTSAHLNTFN